MYSQAGNGFKAAVTHFRVLFLSGLAGAVFFVACAPEQTHSDFILPTPNLVQTATILEHETGSPVSSARLDDERPNIIVILTDDQPYHTVDYMPEVKNFLIPNSVVFENGFVTTPLCCPSRISILTGQYAHNHQVYTDRLPMGGARKFDDTSTLAVWLQNSGYRTGYYGKYLNGYEGMEPYGYVPPGWDEWGVFLSRNLNEEEGSGGLNYYYNFSLSDNGTPQEYLRSKENFSTDVITYNALSFINQSRNDPFLLFVGYYNPHSPYISAPRHRDTFRSGTDWEWLQYRPPNFNEENVGDKPDYLEQLSPLSPEEIDVAHKQILRSLLSVDDGVATIRSVLEETGLTEKTIIIYLSDNGLTLGDHRFGVTKNCPYEACIRVPFIVHAPGYYPPRTESHLVANIDLAPTIAELAGARLPDGVDGDSFVQLLENPQLGWREEILLEHWPTEEGVGAMIPEFYAVRTATWKYVEYSTGEVELYDLVNDPYELINLAGQGKYADIQAGLAARLEMLKAE